MRETMLWTRPILPLVALCHGDGGHVGRCPPPEGVEVAYPLWQAAAAPESLRFVLVGAAIVLPTMFAFSAYSYWVFRGKARALSYQR